MTVSCTLDHLIAQWTRLGVAFSAPSAKESPDLERLLLNTARRAPQNARVFILAVTWLCRYGDLVARHRLKRLVADELELEYRPVLGMLLATVREETGTAHFNAVIRDCPPADEAAPLFEIERKNEKLRRLAERHAAPISRQWNLWARAFRPKDEALRPVRWILERNPGYRIRADLKGDLRASIIAALADDPRAGESEVRLSRCCGATRSAVRDSLDDLETAGRIKRSHVGRRRRISLTGMELKNRAHGRRRSVRVANN